MLLFDHWDVQRQKKGKGKGKKKKVTTVIIQVKYV